MSDQKTSTFAGLTSRLKKPFSLRIQKKKPSFRNVHTTKPWSSDAPKGDQPSPEACNVSSGDDKNVNRIIRMIPGLIHLRKCPEKTGEPKIAVPPTVTGELGELINISPPYKSDRNEQLRTNKGCSMRKSRNSDKPASAKKHHGVPSSHLIHSRRSRRESRTNLKVPEKRRCAATSPRLNPNKVCLNVRVSGPLYCTVEKLMNNDIKKIVTLSGAGISTAAGIPDFRSPDTGLYEKLKKYNLPYAQAVFERKYFDKNPKPLYALLKETLAKEYKPTIAHYFVKLLEEKGLLLRHFTQNVDGLERLAGISEDKIVEAHGTVYKSRCMKCQTEYDLQWLRDQLIYQGKSVPYCQNGNCQGMVKPNVVLFGEALDSQFVTSVRKDLPRCDLLIIMGTSLVVEPFASAVKKVDPSCSRIVINNIPVGEHLGIVYEGSKDFSRKKRRNTWRDAFVQGSCDEGVLHLAKIFKWERELQDLIKRYEPPERRTRLPSPSRSTSPKSDSRSRPRATEVYKKNVAKDTHENKKLGTSNDPRRLNERKVPSKTLLTTETPPPIGRKDELPSSDEASKNWWRSLTSRVRKLADPRR